MSDPIIRFEMDKRLETLQAWLLTTGLQIHSLQPLRNDASFRRYFRVISANSTFIAMDAPPPRENCKPFVVIAKALRQLGIQTPAILASDISQGFLLLTDFGDQRLLETLNPHNAVKLYTSALDSLAILSTCQSVEDISIPIFTADFMRQELELFKEWFLEKHLKISFTNELTQKWHNCFDFLATTTAAQPRVFMHRDYHSANLMCLPQNQIGILDFQDAFMGPVTYDLVSLLRDCYIDWPDELVLKLVESYYDRLKLTVSLDEFYQWFDMMGIQRHLKALLTFSRKFHRDANSNYLQFIPRTVRYIIKISERYPECHFLKPFFLEHKGVVCAE